MEMTSTDSRARMSAVMRGTPRAISRRRRDSPFSGAGQRVRRSAQALNAPGICSTVKLDWRSRRAPALTLVNDVSCNVGVEAVQREHVYDALVVGEQREFSTCGEYARKTDESYDDRMAFLLKGRPTRLGSAD